MQKIALTKDKFSLISSQDEVWLSKHKWYATNCSRPWHSIEKWYAARNAVLPCKKRVKLYLHRAIMARILEDMGVADVEKEMQGKVVDHANGDGLDNRRENLWLIDQAANIPEQTKIHNQPRVKRMRKRRAKGFRRKKKDLV